MSGAAVPPGWPRDVHPPGTDGFQRTAVAWLLDQCPPDYRGHRVLRSHPVALGALAVHHLRGSALAVQRATAAARAELGEDLPPEALRDVLDVLEAEAARVLAAGRAAVLVLDALRGRRYVPRL